MRVCVTGDRYWRDAAYVWNVLDQLLNEFLVRDADGAITGLTEEFVLMEGQCPFGGADKHAAEWAISRRKIGVQHLPFPADWKRYKRAAGPIRNRQMINEGKPDLVIAFHDALTKSKGTKGMVAEAEKAHVETWLIRHENSFD